jgi:hypothetical protein
MFDAKMPGAMERKNLDENHLSPATNGQTLLFLATGTPLFPASRKEKKPNQRSANLWLRKYQVILQN